MEETTPLFGRPPTIWVCGVGVTLSGTNSRDCAILTMTKDNAISLELKR